MRSTKIQSGLYFNPMRTTHPLVLYACAVRAAQQTAAALCAGGGTERRRGRGRRRHQGRTDAQSPHRGRGALAPSAARIIARPLAWRLGASAVAPCRSSGLALFTELYQLPYPRCLVGQVSARSSSRGRMDGRATRGVIWPAALAIGPNPREQFADRAVAVHRRRPKVSCRCH
ncbi:hypothetical protein GQ55_9G033400 [Panicum hallii var. hallii]|uniref:Uncharacterized protein n=1 Tax=Panicum hallii var. hallii TaxID=1504633 RepID=A0A2T7BZ63_9POAL|nr:hypothetical protein GQ55_9G033400 [Panicum hallii var. hallii]